MSIIETHHKKVPVNALSIGMFVAELDRPWLGTPFLLEGVLIEEQSQIDTMVELCEHVYVDLSMSIGDFNLSAVTADTKPQTKPATTSASTHPLAKTAQKAAKGEQFSFFDVLRDIKQYKESESSDNDIQEATNVAFINKQHQAPGVRYFEEQDNTKAELTDKIKQDITDIISGIGKKQPNSAANVHQSEILADHIARKKATNNKSANPVEQEMVKAFPAFTQTQVATKAMFESIANSNHIDIQHVDGALEGMVNSIERNPDALMWLTKLKQSNNDAYNHAMNVSVTMMALGNFMYLPKKQVKDLGMAGLLQDIGKARIDENLLYKTEKITAEDYEVFKGHITHSMDILAKTKNIPKSILQTVAQHHERIDGSGYPNQLSGKQISLTGQMAGLVDTYCALTTDRAYAKGVFSQQALEEIHQLRDQKFSGVLIDQVVQFLGMYPVTTLVELNTGEVGVVIEQNSVRRLLPRVLVLLNADKTKNPHPITLNLINSPKTPSGEDYAIVRSLPPNSYNLNPTSYYASE